MSMLTSGLAQLAARRRAAPALADFNMPATFFLTTGFVDTEHYTWADKLEMILDQTSAYSATMPSTDRIVPLCSLQEKLDALREIKAALKPLPLSQCLAEIAELAGQLEVTECAAEGDYRFMNWDQARSLASAGFDLGAHTINHPILSRIPLEEAKSEVLSSRDCIVAEVGRCSTTFCYPNGKWTDYTKGLIEFCRQHFRAALSTNRGPVLLDELYELRRMGVDGKTTASDLEKMLLLER